ncbi:phosphatidylcholine:ceramide cholinephosphotransferase 1 [Latimeria chalumnae]|uniref:Phosphatidylcholine:ceramide cholinephosphotransferase 1 n=1 Tax=Latimeria chalumnae TaxID=7897 RepID=H3APA5_LATCH|nr:PREDICTED: phosphatidylcholine:ceramide cholinephosphotransferase 1 [Latimeria chalumnae]XP_006005656.1 PREDICTED: phosphatidylcholine:ceramide cholinephosphotransferase 1 [Latimeria chalumnae]XP_006005657.1 PREDICTED: phosphatidylcholine:ceramide cholinephosphotransferase 1 [Latimeria chalumnae]XP_014349736.1 PREDICTED: phosphatidylcholine:ceramide cholinephosphotransferase 1 [Latimeria chalumnae]XP_014349737.1 PREDICTED: phosphatidylcholine:ceramide cholinephosphotransferase 1 [Latimeria c|eukprot:XP_006005654.1 PREDICTED: phosphatidylcholine:ceramide cholinephosphotransferase 1 [Latimeria chalumnae]
MKEVTYWSAGEVLAWLIEQGMPEYSESLQNLNGNALLKLSEDDFKSPPLSLVSSDNGRQLLDKIETLKIEHHIEAHKNGHANGHLPINSLLLDHESDSSSKTLNGLPNGFKKEMVRIPMPELERTLYPLEWKKTGVAFLYALFCFLLTTVMISVVHERVPPKEEQPPLPDKFFDYFNRVEWAFSICEINGMILVGLWFLQWMMLKYKSIIGRRFFFIMGTLYLYRCITMYVTTLPVPGMHFRCSPKLFGDWEAQLRRIMKMIAGGGLSITGSHTMCGDYLYSGHTVMLTLTYLFVKEYSPRRFWWYHRICWVLSVTGIFCILLAHDHYTVDVVVAYFITTRLFWWYHTMANQQVLKEPSHSNFLSRVWWFRAFQYFEKNIQGIVPRSYQWSFSWPVLHLGKQVKYTRVNNDT